LVQEAAGQARAAVAPALEVADPVRQAAINRQRLVQINERPVREGIKRRRRPRHRRRLLIPTLVEPPSMFAGILRQYPQCEVAHRVTTLQRHAHSGTRHTSRPTTTITAILGITASHITAWAAGTVLPTGT
jgi:hypothetical protein